MTSQQLSGVVRGTAPLNYGDGAGDAQFAVNNRGDMSVAYGLPSEAEATRLGNTWHVAIATANAFTHVAAWPTTRAELVLHNGEPSNGKSYVVNSVWAANVATSIVVLSAYTILAQLVASGTAPTDDTAQLITSASGRGTYGGRAKRALASTAFAVANRWQVLGNMTSAVASIGHSVIAQVNGALIIPPGGVLCLNLVTGTAVGTASIGLTWTETQLTLGG